MHLAGYNRAGILHILYNYIIYNIYINCHRWSDLLGPHLQTWVGSHPGVGLNWPLIGGHQASHMQEVNQHNSCFYSTLSTKGFEFNRGYSVCLSFCTSVITFLLLFVCSDQVPPSNNKCRPILTQYPYMQKTCDVAVKAILAKKKLRKKCVNRNKM